MTRRLAHTCTVGFEHHALIRIDHPNVGDAGLQVFGNLLKQGGKPVVGRDDFDRQIGSLEYWRHLVRQSHDANVGNPVAGGAIANAQRSENMIAELAFAAPQQRRQQRLQAAVKVFRSTSWPSTYSMSGSYAVRRYSSTGI